MINKKWIFAALGIFVVLAAYTWLSIKQSNQRQNEIEATASAQSASIAPARVIPPSVVQDVQETIAERQQKLSELAVPAPVSFYGKVLDENGISIPDAQVTIVQRQAGSVVKPESEKATDAKGLFSSPINAMGLSVAISKKGYKTLTTPVGGIEPPHPDPQHPALFVLKKGI